MVRRSGEYVYGLGPCILSIIHMVFTLLWFGRNQFISTLGSLTKGNAKLYPCLVAYNITLSFDDDAPPGKWSSNCGNYFEW